MTRYVLVTMNDSLSLRMASLMVLASSAAILLGAFAFQYIGGLQPCILCWWQRYPYMITIVLGVVATFLAPTRPALARLLLAACAVVFLAGAGIAAFHVGVEQHWWAGTAECGANFGPAGSVDELRRRLLAQAVVRCDDIAWSLFGISMAGYNFLLSLALAVFAVCAARSVARTTLR
jgi:disulfide bond formation protein DsbB